MTNFRPAPSATRTSSSQMNSAGAWGIGAVSPGDGAADRSARSEAALKPRDARNASIRAVNACADTPLDSICTGAFGRGVDVGRTPVPALLGAVFAAMVADGAAGRTSYANRLMLRRCRGEMLSDVMLPPQPPHPSLIAGSSPVVRPIDP